jgi:hypothetical protein
MPKFYICCRRQRKCCFHSDCSNTVMSAAKSRNSSTHWLNIFNICLLWGEQLLTSRSNLRPTKFPTYWHRGLIFHMKRGQSAKLTIFFLISNCRVELHFHTPLLSTWTLPLQRTIQNTFGKCSNLLQDFVILAAYKEINAAWLHYIRPSAVSGAQFMFVWSVTYSVDYFEEDCFAFLQSL